MEAGQKAVREAFARIPLITAEELGDMSVEEYTQMLLDAGNMLEGGIEEFAQKTVDAAQAAADAIAQAAQDVEDRLALTDVEAPLAIIEAQAAGGPQIIKIF